LSLADVLAVGYASLTRRARHRPGVAETHVAGDAGSGRHSRRQGGTTARSSIVVDTALAPSPARRRRSFGVIVTTTPLVCRPRITLFCCWLELPSGRFRIDRLKHSSLSRGSLIQLGRCWQRSELRYQHRPNPGCIQLRRVPCVLKSNLEKHYASWLFLLIKFKQLNPSETIESATSFITGDTNGAKAWIVFCQTQRMMERF